MKFMSNIMMMMILVTYIHRFRMQQQLVVYHQIENYLVKKSSFFSMNSKAIFFFHFLVPDRCTDDIMGLEHFSRVFHARFGSTGPILYIGPLDQAIQDSVLAPRHEVTIPYFHLFIVFLFFFNRDVHWRSIFITIDLFVPMFFVLKS
jgi:hypothetical protein